MAESQTQTARTRPLADLTGTRVGRFDVQARLGSGGMGEVYRAQDTKLKRTVALKRLSPKLAADRLYRQRFLKEAENASALNFPHIAALYDVFEEHEELFLVMEYVDGATLRRRLTDALPLDQFLHIATQCGEALAAAHAGGVVHRDIKPENVMLDSSSQVKVLDFGVAKRLPGAEDITSSETADSTVTSGFSGTPAYMAPEVLLEREADGRADIFSLGVVFYEALTGSHPFRSASFVATAERILHETPPPVRKANARVPEELERIIGKMMAKSAEQRYATARDLVVDLRALERASLPRIFLPRLGRGTGRPAAWRALAILGAAGAIVLAGVMVGMGPARERVRRWLGWTPAAAVKTERIRLAVLPFENLSRNPEQEYFCDGLTEEMINQLGRIEPKRLAVIGRASVMRYKGAQKQIDDIRRNLMVDYILQGGVALQGERVRITAQLIQTSDQTVLWAGSYPRSKADVFALQSEVTGDIARSLALELLPHEQRPRAPTSNSAAYEAYLRGLDHWNKGSLEQRRKAGEFFDRAVTLDPKFAAAYAGLADFFLSASSLPPGEAVPNAKELLRKALELDPWLPYAHASLGSIKFLHDQDWEGAEQEFKRALELNPSDAESRRKYSAYLLVLGRFEDGLGQLQRAQELDPFSHLISVNLGWGYYFARRYERALEQCRKSLELESNSEGAHDCLGQSYRALGEHEKAIAESQTAVQLSGNNPRRAVGLAMACAAAGQRGEAEKILRDVERETGPSHVPPYLLAKIYVTLGQKERALAALEKAFAERDSALVWLKVEPAFDSLRGDARFQQLVRRVGLPE